MFRSFISARKTLLVTVISLSFIFSACAQNAGSTKPAVDLDALKTKVVAYINSLNASLEDVNVEEIEKDKDSPFYKGTVTFTARNQKAKNPFYVTADGQYLVLGQVWDMNVDPLKARWMQKTEGAEERMAQIDLSDRPVKGDADAKVVVVEYSDYQCPFCSKAYQTIEEEVMAKYKGRVKLVFKHLPIASIHPWATKASIAAACAYVQDKDAFWGMHSRLFENQRTITVDNLRERVETYAGEINLDKAAFTSCLDSESTRSVVDADLREAASLGISSTPTFVINGALVPGAIPFEEFSTYIDWALEQAEKK